VPCGKCRHERHDPGTGNAGKRTDHARLAATHQIDEQGTNDALKGENGTAGKVASGLAVSGDVIHRSDESVDFIDRNGICGGGFLDIFSYISMV
jgi:hypothetical protein